MGKNKLARWAELKTFKNVIQAEPGIQTGEDHPVKGKWKQDIFHNNNPVVLELGCGKGEYTTGLAERFPDRNYIGVDIKGARMWRGAKTAHEKNIPNAAFLRTRIEFAGSFFARDEVDEIWLTFPDPHAGRKNSNKKLTCPWFLNLYRSFLKDNGTIWLKTDNAELYNYTRSLAEKNKLPLVMATTDLYGEDDPDDIFLIRTYYENNYLNEGRKIHLLAFTLPGNKIIEDEISKYTGRK
ncbi:MAG: tRNA (guanosine(46)-N7)-methyltransferase TrmB [Bacteroidales bacterium]|nr:tRNA (guanosine(46)-N7)-methyltransferase TrmB [Bacteroidales bacterium]